MNNDKLVLVTGGSGFLGAHCILQLLKAGYRVRTTVRSLQREADVRAMLKTGGDRLSFVVADLVADNGWAAAVAGCDYVLHVASPFPPGAPKHEDELVIPARDGALRVLRAARDAGVKRVVLTSSFAAVGYSTDVNGQLFTEEDWTNPDDQTLAPYIKSKTVAEKAAWDFMTREGGKMELAVVNPVAIFGPVLGADYSTSISLVQTMLSGKMPRCPRLSFNIVDVRDVADLHLRAMTHPAAAGQRFLAVAGENMSLQQVALMLREKIGDAAQKAPVKVLPDWIIKFAALFNPMMKLMVPELGIVRSATNEKARRLLDWAPRSNEEAITATAKSLIQLGLTHKS